MPCTIRLKGRLGNQICQISTLIAYSMKHGIDYIIPEHTLNDGVWPPYFSNLHYPHKHSGNIISISEESHAYKTIPFEENWAGHLIELDGYYQSYKYFDVYKDKISEILGFKTHGFPFFKKSVGIHIRRGDYLLYPDKHPVVSLEYLETAIKIFGNGYDYEIFTDDPAWVHENFYVDFFKEKLGTHEVYLNPLNDPLIALWYYARHDHYIISNSTYSYCGAFFGSGNGKVVTPHEDNWFGQGNSHLSVADLLPKEWIRIKY